MKIALRPRGRRVEARDELVRLLTAAQLVDSDGWPVGPRHAPGAWLVQADLRQADLRDVDLSHANLRGADLRGADLRHASLRHAVLAEADLRLARFDEADLSWCNLNESLCTQAGFSRARLTEATFHGADLCGADLRTVTGLTSGCLKALRSDVETAWPPGFDPADPRVGGPLIHRSSGRS